MQVSLLFPPTWHPSQSYLSLPSLTGFLAQGGVSNVSQRDLGIGLLNGLATKPHGAGHYWEAENNRRIKYSVIGDSVSNCLCGPAGKGAIPLSAALHAALDFLPSMQLKGKGQALPVFRVKR